MILSFDRRVRAHDGRPFAGFAIAGEDRHFHPARAEFVVVGKQDNGRDKLDEAKLKVWHPLVPEPRAVRYAWARNPIANAVNSNHHERTIPIVSFRTDNWDWPEAPIGDRDSEASQAHRREINERRRQAKAWVEERRVAEAKAFLESRSESGN